MSKNKGCVAYATRNVKLRALGVRSCRHCSVADSLLIDISVCNAFSFGTPSSSAFEALRGHRLDGGDKVVVVRSIGAAIG